MGLERKKEKIRIKCHFREGEPIPNQNPKIKLPGLTEIQFRLMGAGGIVFN